MLANPAARTRTASAPSPLPQPISPPSPAPAPVHPGVSFVRRLESHGDQLAVVAPDGTALSYRELAQRVSAMARRIGPERRLVLVTASNDLEPLVAYLGALAGGHPVLLCCTQDRGHLRTLLETYDPDVVFEGTAGAWHLRERRRGTAHQPHPDLALLLSTSGSTGSPKLVRLSAANLQANAESIAEYLDIRRTDRAVTSLPMHYCYGLSVINSNLLRGAGLVLTNDSVVDDGFWTAFRDNDCTSLQGVPYTFELLDRIGFERMDLPGLRYVTQAGGRLAPEVVRRYARLGERDGWRLFVMYGQTEATARMAYLPAELAAERPSAIGVPIPGGRFELDTNGERAEGELVYRGPNVMLGYAESAADLSSGRTIDALHTGDLARRAFDGLYEVIGRKNRFIKPFGLRIDLDRLELVLAEAGVQAACTGDDDALIVAVAEGDGAEVRELVTARTGLPGHRVRVRELIELPRLSTGKLDYAALAEPAEPERLSAAAEEPRPSNESLRATFRRVLRRTEVDGDATFVSLGGDSLSYVQMSIELERALGHVPDGWPTMPVRELERFGPSRGPFAAMETNILLRAVAIILVVGTHIGIFHILGGAHLLLVISGWCFARFGLAPDGSGSPGTRILRSATRIAVPAMLWLTFRAAVTDDVILSNVFLINNYLQTGAPGFWYVEVLVQALLLAGLVFAVPAVARFERRHGFAVALLVLGLAFVARLFIDDANVFPERGMSTHGVIWFFALGWLAHRAVTAAQKWLVIVLAVLLIPGFFEMPVRETVIGVGFLLVLLVPRLPVPRPAVRVVGLVASASLYIYLTHYALYPELLAYLPPLAVTLLSLVVGILAWWTVEKCTAVLARVPRLYRRKAVAFVR